MNALRERLFELIADSATGKASHTRLWANVGLALSCVVFVRLGWTGQLTAEVFGLFMFGVCGNAAVSKALSLKYSGGKAEGTA